MSIGGISGACKIMNADFALAAVSPLACCSFRHQLLSISKASLARLPLARRPLPRSDRSHFYASREPFLLLNSSQNMSYDAVCFCSLCDFYLGKSTQKEGDAADEQREMSGGERRGREEKMLAQTRDANEVNAMGTHILVRRISSQIALIKGIFSLRRTHFAFRAPQTISIKLFPIDFSLLRIYTSLFSASAECDALVIVTLALPMSRVSVGGGSDRLSYGCRQIAVLRTLLLEWINRMQTTEYTSKGCQMGCTAPLRRSAGESKEEDASEDVSPATETPKLNEDEQFNYEVEKFSLESL